MKVSNFADRLKEALDIRGMKQSELCEIGHFDKGQVSSWLSGKYSPRQKNIDALSRILSVNEAWLLGYDDLPMERTSDADRFRQTAKVWNEAHPIKQKITETEFLLIKKFRALDERGQRAVLSTLDAEYKYARKAKNEFLAAHGAVKLTEEQKHEIKKWSDTDVEQ